MAIIRYSEWDGTQEIPDLNPDDLLESLTDDLMNFGDLQHALRNLLQRGMRDPMGQRVQGLRDLLQQLRQQRRSTLDQYNLSSVFEDIERRLEELLTAESTPRLLWLLVIFAVTPALCEEAVFRGVLLSGTRESGSAIRIALLNGLVFGVFHVSFESVFRFLPTAWLGAVLAWAVLTTSSIWVGTLMHFVNNGSIVLMASIPALRAWLEGGGGAPPWVLLAPALLAVAVGVRLLSIESDPSR